VPSLTPDAVAAMFATKVAGGQVTSPPKRSAPQDGVIVYVVHHCMECGVEMYSPRLHDNVTPMTQKFLCATCADF
jgi:hypothetical protein